MRGRYEQALSEVEEMKRRLREHAQRVAAREKELDELRLEVAGRQGRRRPAAPTAPTGPDRSDELARKIAEAEKREREAVQELALAKAERERLDEREQAIRKVERELAGLRTKPPGGAGTAGRLALRASPSRPAIRSPRASRRHRHRSRSRRPSRISSRPPTPKPKRSSLLALIRSSGNQQLSRAGIVGGRSSRGGRGLLRRASRHVYLPELSRPTRPRPAADVPASASASGASSGSSASSG